MVGNTSKETHFACVEHIVRCGHLTYVNRRLNIVSDSFKSKAQPARHRMVYTLLNDELKQEGGIHALQLRTKTPEEEEKLRSKEAAAAS